MKKFSFLKPSHSNDFAWPYWLIVPIYPYGERRTIRQEIEKDTIWTFEQLQGIFYVVVPIRMTVIKLDGGGLLVYAPVAPTHECINLMRQLEARHGEVKYIILPTISGIEHKVFVGPFARFFPSAEVFIAPDQWSFPLNLPVSWLGLPPKRTHVLPDDPATSPFAGELGYDILPAIDLNLGDFSEVAFFHRASRTLLVTDTIVSVPDYPPPILEIDPYPLLFHAKDTPFDSPADTPENRRKGWQRICLFSLYFQPHSLGVPRWQQVFANAFQVKDRSKKNYFGLYPFQWSLDWPDTFNSLRNDGRPIVAPILQTLILNRTPERVLAWAERVSMWDFQRIIPCHFAAPVTANGESFKKAFSFLEDNNYLPREDLAYIRGVDKFLYSWKIIPPPVTSDSHGIGENGGLIDK
ncbi:MAG: hypothetical protein N5P05_002269 [Chroococcopsis gigantea SAG 12.99]|jgi:hypothetical protein|nr:DUF4336 domain-containing protein [Chlorogloea purpurea SAG 13.99]MDV3000663.1 hypothetical protein [Chroococcopsis gigantea SAG 12.99]